MEERHEQKEDEHNVHALKDLIIAKQEDPEPCLLHAVAAIFENAVTRYKNATDDVISPQELVCLCDLIWGDKKFSRLLHSFLQNAYLVSVKVAAARLFSSCSPWRRGDLRKDNALDKTKDWVRNEIPRRLMADDCNPMHETERRKDLDSEMMCTYYTGLHATILDMLDIQPAREVLTCKLPAELMRYLSIKILDELYSLTVLGLLVEVMAEDFKENIGLVLPFTRSILQSALSALAHREHNMSGEPAAPFWKEVYYSLVLFEKILHQFHDLFFDTDLEDMWEIICQFLLHPHSWVLHPHLWLRNISNRILSLYFAVIDAHTKNYKMPMEMFFLMKPSRLFLVAASFCSQLMAPLADDAACSIIMQNLVFSICHLHSILGKNACMDGSKFWSSLEIFAQDQFHKAFTVLDPLKGRRMLFSFTSDVCVQRAQNQHPFISYLLQKLGKISFQMEATQMKIVFNCFKSISPELLGCYGKDSLIAYDDSTSYAYQMLLPLYKVCEGYTGKVVSDDLKQLAQEVRESIRVIMGNYFIQVYKLVRKNLKGKRDKRKQDEKIMAVVNPEQNAKRKLRIAAKHRNNKRRKVMSMKIERWMN